MDPKDLKRLTERIGKLEAFNRRLSRAVVVLLLILASAVWMGQNPPTTPQKPATPKPAQKPARKAPAPTLPKVVEAEQFVLRSASGQLLATLGLSGGGPTLRLVGPNGSERAVLGLDATGTPRLAMMRPDGTQPITIALSADGVPKVELAAPDKALARLTIGSQGPGLGLVDSTGVVRLALDLDPEGPTIAFIDRNKVTRASFNTIERGPNLVLFDEEGRSRMMFSVRPGQAAFGIQDSKGDVRLGLEVRGENPALALYGPNGKPTFVR
jgi:hypothetical protein